MTMFKRIGKFLLKWLIGDEPKDQLACGDCDATDCTNEKFRTCERRIARDEAVKL